MNNDSITKKSWFETNWMWFLLFSVIGILLLFGIILKSGIAENATNFSRAYADKLLFNNAIKLIKTNKKAIEILGNIEPIDDLAIFEGDVKYSNNNNSVDATIRIKGDKSKAKMDISANKNDSIWVYKKIIVRIKSTKEIIEIVK